MNEKEKVNDIIVFKFNGEKVDLLIYGGKSIEQLASLATKSLKKDICMIYRIDEINTLAKAMTIGTSK